MTMFDIHCHILFDVDDGSSDFDESRRMLKAARAVGIDTIVCTPHCRGSRFDYDRIQKHYAILRDYATAHGFSMALGFEVFWQNLVTYGIDNAWRLCIEDTDLLLLEFSSDAMPANWERMIYSLTGQGITPIIAHPERYRAVQNDLDIAERLKDMGCLLQLSGNFATGGMFSPSKKAAIKMLERGLIDYVASDAHCPEHYQEYAEALKLARKHG